MPINADKLAAAKKKAEEMKAAAAAKRAAHEKRKLQEGEGGEGASSAEADTREELFVLGEHSLILVDWDDTLFPTSAWKNRIAEGATHPPRASKVQALSEAISELILALKKVADVKIVTHGTKGWFQHSSAVLLPETKALLDGLDHRYRDSCGGKYMQEKPRGQKYTTDIGVQVDHYGEWFKTDMFFHYISERKHASRWDEVGVPQKVILPKQVLIIGDGHAEKRSYTEHGNQARIYAQRPGHKAVASVGLKGLFLKEQPSYDELLLQLRWAAGHVASLLPADDTRMMRWDLTGFPTWVCSAREGANEFQPVDQGSLMGEAGAAAGATPMVTDNAEALTAEEEEERAIQRAIELSLVQS